jgi:hypothetical protein
MNSKALQQNAHGADECGTESWDSRCVITMTHRMTQ